MSEIRIVRGGSRRRSRYRRRPFRKFLIILICVLLLVAGFFGALLLDHWIKYQREGGAAGVSSEASSLPEPSSGADSSLPESRSGPESEPEPEPDPPARMLLVPASSLDGPALDALCARVQEYGIDTIVVDLKTDDGLLHYPSALAAAQQAGAVDPAAADPRPGVARLQQSGAKVLAQMACFRDPTAARRLPGAAVLYGPAPTMYWLDAPNGKPWLDPYAPAAVDYLTSVAGEISGLGFDGLCLNRVQFPDLVSSTSRFRTDGRTRGEALAALVASIRSAADGKPVLLRCPAAAAAGAASPVYGDANPLNFGADGVILDLRLSLLGDRLVLGETVLDAPASAPEQATELIVQALHGTAPGCTYLLGADDALAAQREALRRLVPDAELMLAQSEGVYTDAQLSLLQ